MRASAEPSRLVVVDRDGVINEDSAEFIKSVTEWRPIEGSLEALAALNEAGFRIAVVTNQSGVGRGLLDERTLASIHRHMEHSVRAAGGELAGIYYCPHLPEAGCDCRKPRPGLLRAVERDLGLPLRGAAFIGDRQSDIDAARAVSARPILVRTGKGRSTEGSAGAAGVEVFDNLRAAAQALIDAVRT
jgi:D-glycero-D-manno-heptose 1,7-bisphosphate phosphatase